MFPCLIIEMKLMNITEVEGSIEVALLFIGASQNSCYSSCVLTIQHVPQTDVAYMIMLCGGDHKVRASKSLHSKYGIW